mmetsp:Transcript_12616/g.23955  ORF Transcript_12616/g.23955 Transcript_12616/m.23955 type:complete len:167 (-) Transcript_12616:449-949(-)
MASEFSNAPFSLADPSAWSKLILYPPPHHPPPPLSPLQPGMLQLPTSPPPPQPISPPPHPLHPPAQPPWVPDFPAFDTSVEFGGLQGDAEDHTLLSKDAVGIISCLVFLGIGLLVIVVMFYKSRRQAAHQIEEQTPVLGVDKGTQQLSYRRLNYGSLSPEIDENMV